MTKRRTFRARDGYEAADLLAYAHDHFRAARHLWLAGFEYMDSAAYLAHLAFEILLKAWLLHVTGAFQDGHDLKQLVIDLRGAGTSLHLTNSEDGILFVLDTFAATRYPKPNEPVQVGSGDLPLLSKLWDRLTGGLPANLISAYESLPPNRKGGRVLMVKNALPE